MTETIADIQSKVEAMEARIMAVCEANIKSTVQMENEKSKIAFMRTVDEKIKDNCTRLKTELSKKIVLVD